jgi:hypothetical protein
MASVQLDLSSILHVIRSFLLEQRYIGTLRALEQESGVVLGGQEDLAFLRTLVLDGRWEEVEDIVAPLRQQPSDYFDATGVLFHLRKQRFLEMFSGGGRDADDGGVVMALVAALRGVRDVARDSQAFNSLCYCLTLGSVIDHPDFKDWTPFWGRQCTWLAVRADFERVFPSRVSETAPEVNVPDGQLLRLLALAGAARVVAEVCVCVCAWYVGAYLLTS